MKDRLAERACEWLKMQNSPKLTDAISPLTPAAVA